MATLNVAFLWHMHQPCYREPDNRVFRLPWVRLHALKDYYDMLSVALRYPEIKLTFNLVPVLLEQLKDYASGQCSDIHQEVSRKPAQDLTDEEKAFILRDFFMANWANMVDIYPRYRELLNKRGRAIKEPEFSGMIRRFSVQDYRDLQVWFNLCWTDPMHFEREQALAGLRAKGANFSEEDKLALWESQNQIISSIIPLYKKAWESGQIEISTTPYYHPILPLLCDSDIARESMPDAPLPSRFVHPDDARNQIVSGLDFIQNLMGCRPAGMWPSEGSVSQQAVELMAGSGIRWLATDEGILERSLGRHLRRGQELSDPDTLFLPYSYAGANIFFRDRMISDKLGFDYYNWDQSEAAKDLVYKLENYADRLGEKASRHIVPVILDGENVWEFFPGDGHEFLDQLYGRLSSSRKLRCCTFSQYLDEHANSETLKKVFPGSWINSDFRIWIGAEEDNTAWEHLHKARRAIKNRANELKGDPDRLRRVMEELYIAEGSDWCWWYGGNYSGDNIADFDGLFRGHLREVYRLLGEEVPEKLFSPISKSGKDERRISDPIAFISPRIDGRISDFYEWSGSGLYQSNLNGGAMRRGQSIFRSLRFGFDARNLYIRLDPSPGSTLADLKNARLTVDLLEPARVKLEFGLNGGPCPEGCRIASDKITEMEIPFDLTRARTGQQIKLIIILEDSGVELEKLPEGQPLSIKMPDRNFEDRFWEA